MFDDLPLFPEQASSVAPEVDALFLFMVALAGFFATLICVLTIYFAVKYRRRPGDKTPKPVHGSLALELTWTIIPFVLAMGTFLWGAKVFINMSRVPADAVDVAVVGKRWMWKFQHADGRREINELHVPVGRAVKLTMGSEDVIHSLYVPAFRVKADVIPGRFATMWFRATKAGSYHLFCAEYCGTKHSGMIGKVIVMEPANYQVWLAGGASSESLAAAGERVFQELACVSCHKADPSGRGPALAGLAGKEVRLATGGTVVADDTYLRESIVAPAEKIVAGYQPIMPTYQGLVTEEKLMQLVAYVKSQGAAGTAAVGAAPAPAGDTAAGGNK